MAHSRNNMFMMNSSSVVMDSYNYGVDSSSDEETKSSDDDIDDFYENNQDNDSDSFEKEMERELNNEFLKHRQEHFHNIMKPSTENQGEDKKDNSQQEDTIKKKVYEDDYFSSGSEDEDKIGGVKTKSKERREIPSDDELLYDPNMDTDDENWVKKQREDHQNKSNSNQTDASVEGGSKTQKGEKSTCTKTANSDAILSCPACLTTLCIDCQRHETYKTQFRAMFVMNCNIITDETLRYEPKKEKKKPNKKKKKQEDIASTSTEATEDEQFQPVQCALCNTEVAVYDKDEVYHFFDIVESLS